MTNELIFFLHVLVVVAWSLGALRLGKEALIASISLQALIANLFVVKQISLFSLDVCCADVYMVGCMLSLDLLQEFFGMKAAKQGIWVSFFSLIFFGMMSQFHLFYTPNAYDYAHTSYAILLASQPRFLIASFLSYLTTQQVDRILFQKLRNSFPRMPFSLRSAFSTLPSQVLDNMMFAFIGLLGIVPNLWPVIFMASLIKFIVIFTAAPFTELARKFAPPQLAHAEV